MPHIYGANDNLAEWLPDEAENWPPDELRDFVLESNVSDSYINKLLDYLDYEENDLQNDDFWVAFQNMMYGQAENTTYGCDNPKYKLIDWIEWSLLPSFFIIGVFAFTQPRKRLWPDCCNQRPSIAFPVNLIDAFEESWFFACGFAIMTTSILDLFTGNFYYNPDISHWPNTLQGTVWMSVIVVNTMQVSMAYYPMLLCLTNIKKHPKMANGFGLIYTLIWTYYYVYRLYECPFEQGLKGEINTAMLAPIYFCYLILNARFIYGIYSHVRNYMYEDTEVEVESQSKSSIEDDFKKTHYYERVQFLLSPPNPEPSDKKSFSVRLREKIYPYYTGFKYSRRMVCTSVLVTLALYELGLYYVLAVGSALAELIYVFRTDGYLYELFELANATQTFYDLKFVVKVLDDTFWPTSYIALGVMIFFSILMHWNYRHHILKLWRGDRSFSPREKFAFSTKVVASLRFSGYHIGFSLWGALLLQILLWLIVVFVIVVIIEPWGNGETNVIIQLISDYWLATLLGLAFYYLQVLYARMFFLQGKGDVLGLDNRRNFHVTVYVTLFLNAILGLASCLMRILKALLFGILFIGRVDQCTLMRGFELWDPGFKAYIGFLELEVAHTHPVMVTFCHMLWVGVRQRRRKNFENSCALDDVSADGGAAALDRSSLKECQDDSQEILRKRRARNRWFIALTLMRNRELCVQRQPLLPELAAIRSESKLQKAADQLVKDDEANLEDALTGAAASLVSFVTGSRGEIPSSTTDAPTDTKLKTQDQKDDDIMPGQVTPAP